MSAVFPGIEESAVSPVRFRVQHLTGARDFINAGLPSDVIPFNGVHCTGTVLIPLLDEAILEIRDGIVSSYGCHCAKYNQRGVVYYADHHQLPKTCRTVKT